MYAAVASFFFFLVSIVYESSVWCVLQHIFDVVMILRSALLGVCSLYIRTCMGMVPFLFLF